MEKHSDGPWQTTCKERMVVDAKGMFVADIHFGRGMNRDREIANARLIAAAPDLFAACNEVQMLMIHHRQLRESFPEVAAILNAAMHKALK